MTALQWAALTPPTDVVIDSPTAALEAAAAAQGGRCLMCQAQPARFCGSACATTPSDLPDSGACQGCGKAQALYCGPACAAQGR